ncbi:LicD family protein, partial [Streptococcus mitis]
DKVIIGNKSYEIYIDLFPLDGTPNNKLLRNIFLSKFVFYRTLYKLSIVNQLNIVDRGFVGNSIVWLMKMIGISKLLPTEQIVEKIHSIAETYDFESSTYVGNILGRYRKKEIVDKTIFGSGIKLDFEELQLNCPEVFDSYLKHIYGDYMKLPKEEDRVAHFEELNVQG